MPGGEQFADRFTCGHQRQQPGGAGEDGGQASEPGRVPIGTPSSAVNPIVLSMLRPPESAHIEAPLPRCATITRRLAMPGAISDKRPATYS